MRLIFENSTVCLISRRISLFCPVDVNVCPLSAFFGVGGGCWCRGFFDNDSDSLCQFRFLSGDVALFFLACLVLSAFGWVVLGVWGFVFRWRV